MPFNTSWESKGVYFRFYGEVTPAEMQAAQAEVYGDHRFDEIKYFVCDLTDADHLALEESDVEYSAATDRGAAYTIRHIKGALVASDPGFLELIDRYIKMSSRLGSSWDLRKFRGVDEAREWLSV